MISGKNALTCYPAGLKDAPERTCEACGKTFRAGEQYAYKLWSNAAHKKHDWYCSYTCCRTVTKPLEERQKERKQRQNNAAKEREKKQDETIAQMIARMRRESEKRKKQNHD